MFEFLHENPCNLKFKVSLMNKIGISLEQGYIVDNMHGFQFRKIGL